MTRITCALCVDTSMATMARKVATRNAVVADLTAIFEKSGAEGICPDAAGTAII
jgi:ribose 5-phosphate isomerase RpiB